MNIVSIDFDIIMKPSIEYYNNFAGKSMRDKLFQDPLLMNCQADLKIYQKLSGWLFNMAKILPASNIIFIESHDRIVSHIENDNHIFLTNIDHHHDIGYNEDSNIITKENLSCGNWGKYLLDNKLIKKYTWICNQNSNKWNFNYSYQFIDNIDLSSLQADKIIICLSPEWVPPQYQHLFFTWMSTIGILKDTNYYLN